jgi:hypothetical protein
MRGPPSSGSLSYSPPEGSLDLGDVDLAHLHHRRESSLRPFAVRVDRSRDENSSVRRS